VSAEAFDHYNVENFEVLNIVKILLDIAIYYIAHYYMENTASI